MRYLARRLLRLIPVLFLVTLFTYVLIDLLPSDAAEHRLGASGSQEAVDEFREQIGLDDPLPVRYVRWMGDVATGDLGKSLITDQPVGEALTQRIGVTLELLVISQMLALLVAVPIGILAARRPGSRTDRIASGSAFAFASVPNFIMGVILVLVFAIQLGWLPATGLPVFSENPAGHIQALVLPALTLAMAELAAYVRIVRSEMIATLQEDYILNARAKGLSGRWILFRHALRPSSLSLVTLVGLNAGRLIGGAVVVEVIFVLPGMGSLGVSGIYSRDYTMVQGFIIVVAVGYVLVNLLVDALYVVLDPRIRRAAAT